MHNRTTKDRELLRSCEYTIIKCEHKNQPQQSTNTLIITHFNNYTNLYPHTYTLVPAFP